MGFMIAEVMYFCYEYEGLFYARDHILSERIDMYHAKKKVWCPNSSRGPRTH